MSNTIKKGGNVNVTTKTGKNYSFGFVTLAQIHEWLDANGLSYEATTQRVEDREYMFITKIDKDGNKSQPMQAARIPLIETKGIGVAEVMQDYGSVLAMARRYSLMMVYGLAPADDEELPPPSRPTYNQPKPESGRYGAPAGDLDFDEVDAKLAKCETIKEVDAYWAELQKGDLSWRQKAALENKIKKRRQWIIADNK